MPFAPAKSATADASRRGGSVRKQGTQGISRAAANSRSRGMADIIGGGTPKKQRPLQAKAVIAPSNDRYEREADAVASAVAGGRPAPSISTVPSEVRSKSIGAGKNPPSTHPAPGSLGKVLNRGKAGSPLPGQVRRRIERSTGANLSGVRVHQDAEAAAAGQSIRARAFTHGRDIYMGPGERTDDVLLMAHEAAHVLQQSGADPPGPIQRKEKQDTESKTGPPPEPVSLVQRYGLGDLAGDVWDATGGQVVDAAEAVYDSAAELGTDAFWAVIGAVAPSLVPIIKKISSVGIFGYLKDLVLSGMGSIFSGLGNPSEFLSGIFETIGGLGEKAAGIVEMLGDFTCTTFFGAIDWLKETLGAAAGEAWEGIKNFFAPIGDFFSDLWTDFGAPALDWLKATGNSAWQAIKDMGSMIWSYVAPIKNKLSAAWDFVAEQLGLGSSESSSEGGLMQWVTDSLTSVWDDIKATLQPVIAPVQEFVGKVKEVLPLDAIFNLRETLTGWLNSAAQTASSLEEEDGAAKNHASLKDEIIPAMLNNITLVQTSMGAAGNWIAEKIGVIATTVGTMISSVAANPILGFAASALDWVKEKINTLVTWVESGVKTAFGFIQSALGVYRSILEKLLNFFFEMAGVVGDLVGNIGKFVTGALFGWIPECFREPIKNFLLQQILGRIPIFNQLLQLPDIWAKVQDVAMTILTKVFVTGDILGAMYAFFKAMLGLIGLPAKLVVSIIAKAAKSMGDILSHPVRFLMTLLKAVRDGFFNFFGNFLKHMANGFVDWLFGTLTSAGIELPKDFSLSSILKLVFQILGITADKVWKLIGEKIGPQNVERLKKMMEVATGVWGFVKKLITGDFAGIWEDIKSQITGLWTTVMGMAIEWISAKIIKEMTVKILGMLDPSGIMAIVNSCIAIYKFIESVAQYARQILEFIDRVFSGIAEIAAGVHTTGAVFLETALAKGIPIAIGFLANQVGLGDLGKKIQSIIGKIQGTVENALRWLVNKAWAAGKWILDKLKQGAKAVGAKIASWLGLSKRVTVDGDKHRVFMDKKSDTDADLMIQSTKMPLTAWLDIEENKPSVSAARKKQIKKIRGWAKDIETLKAKSMGQDRGKDISDKFDLIVAEMLKMGDDNILPPTTVTWTPHTATYDHPDVSFSSTDGGEMVARPLSINPGGYSGSEPYGESELWKHVRQRPNTYIRGHMLNHNLFGAGSVENMSPIPGDENKAMSKSYEEPLKKKILSENKVFSYEVKMVYGSRSPRRHLKHEHRIPTAITMTAKEMKLKENATDRSLAASWEDDTSKILFSSSLLVDLNKIPDTNPLEGQKEYHRVNLKGKKWVVEELGEADSLTILKRDLAHISGVGPTTVEALTSRSWGSWKEVRENLKDAAGRPLISDAAYSSLRDDNRPVMRFSGETIYGPKL